MYSQCVFCTWYLIKVKGRCLIINRGCCDIKFLYDVENVVRFICDKI